MHFGKCWETLKCVRGMGVHGVFTVMYIEKCWETLKCVRGMGVHGMYTVTCIIIGMYRETLRCVHSMYTLKCTLASAGKPRFVYTVCTW